MTTVRNRATEARPLKILGIKDTEDRVYRWLLTHPGTTAVELARALSLRYTQARERLAAIEAKGLATRTPEKPHRYLPISPDIALKALVLRHHKELQRAENEIQTLQEHASIAQRREKQEQTVELVTSLEAVQQIFERMQQTAQYELATLVRFPMLISDMQKPDENQRQQRAAQRRGVRIRSIVDVECLSSPGFVQVTREDMRLGEEIRLAPDLPFKMFIADRRLALIPLKLNQSDSASLIVRSSALLNALHAMFEMFWKQAAPLSLVSGGALGIGEFGAGAASKLEDMVQLMAAGLNDKKIADELGISMRTLRRHAVALMKELNASTRFQAGWVSAWRLANQRSEKRPEK